MTKSLDEKIADLKEEHRTDLERKVDQLLLHHAIEKALPDVGVPWKFFTGSKLYGSKASCYIDYNFYDHTGKKPPQPDINTIIQASKTLVPVSLTKCADSCLSYRPTSYVDAMPESKKEHWREETIVTPFTVEYDVFQNPQFTVHWYAEMEGVGLVSVKIMIRLERELFGSLYPNYERTGSGRFSETIIKNMHFDPAKETITIFNDDGDPVAERQIPITWASGGKNIPSRKLLYWLDLNFKQTPTIENLLKPFLTKMDK